MLAWGIGAWLFYIVTIHCEIWCLLNNLFQICPFKKMFATIKAEDIKMEMNSYEFKHFIKPFEQN